MSSGWSARPWMQPLITDGDLGGRWRETPHQQLEARWLFHVFISIWRSIKLDWQSLSSILCVCVCVSVRACECVRACILKRERRQSQRTVCLCSRQVLYLIFHLHPTGSIHDTTFYISVLWPLCNISLLVCLLSDSVYFRLFFCEAGAHALFFRGLICVCGIMGLCFRDNQTPLPNADTKITDWII